MLILSRKESESIIIGDGIEVKVVQTGKGYAKIGIEAPKSLMILRKELIAQITDENLHAIVQNDVKLEDLSKKIMQ
ncbi:carbon storage regulator [Campylobacter sp. MIT 21-1685]|uniref:carbon storage regulator n=1 Tax=unclassified Campylobacter TaxID=2593542 RepID=UPI00224B6592|nr:MULTISPECIES: carbon storage regulator [unclassified Campylobacter]MCX2682419.1 carbon storage regulator [Campylobacter sp. MIT 21-1684]MCX2750699.1 carbon storage regulator [Campylobacter sp. MIT 21-1682]MCX2806753.1 carbon storage regulator [Campylobacter sp. MIT 21-1685]